MAEDIASLSSTCFKLNSLQLESLLSRYQPADHEAPIEKELIDTIVRVAQNTVDTLTRKEGRQVRLEEDFMLQLPFLLPEDNYSCDIVRGVPSGLVEFIAPLQAAGLCVMTPQPTSSGHWTIYLDTPPPLTPLPPSPSELSQAGWAGESSGPGLFGGDQPGPGSSHGSQQEQGEPEVQSIRLAKTNGMGLSIVAAKGNTKDKLGIYIKAVVEGGAAWQDGRLEAGDQLLAVDGQTLLGITQERAAQIMMGTGPVVRLDVAKRGAFYHGLDQLLSRPSPVTARHNGESHPQQQQQHPAGPQRVQSVPQMRGPPGPPDHPGSHQGPHPGPHPSHLGPLGHPGHPGHQGFHPGHPGQPGYPGQHMAGPPNLPGRIPQSKSTPSLAAGSADSQHNYQNQEWLHHQLPARGPPGPPGPPGPAGRSASTQNLARPPIPVEHE